MNKNDELLSVLNVSVNINQGKRMLNNLLVTLIEIHDSTEGKPFTIDDINVTDSTDNAAFYAEQDKLDIMTYQDIPVFGEENQSLWTMLFLRTMSLIHHTIDPIRTNYISGNHIVASYELGKAIDISSEICTDMFCLVMEHPKYMEDKAIKAIFIDFVKFVKYMRILDKAIGKQYLRQMAS